MARDVQPQRASGFEGRFRSVADDHSALRAANLCTPVFKEPWCAGSPLNWCEFIARWQACRAEDDGGPVGAELEG